MNLGAWNFVAAIDVDKVNAELAAQPGALIRTFSLSGQVVASGSYGNWRIVPGGSGKILAMEIAIQDGQMQAPTGPIALHGSVLVLSIRLDLLPIENGGHTLVMDVATVTLREMRALPPGLGEIAGAALGTALAQNISAHADQVTFVLARMAPLGPDAPPWLALGTPEFGYLVPEGGKPSLAIFAQPGSAEPVLKLDPTVIGPDGFGLAISGRSFMRHIFRPALFSALGIPPDLRDEFNLPYWSQPGGDFSRPQPPLSRAQASPDSASFSIDGNHDLPSVSAGGGHYTPVLTSLQATLADDRVTIAFAGHCNLQMDISMDFNGSSSVTISMPQPGTLAFAPIGPSSFDKDVHIPWYDHLLDIAGGVAELILQLTVNAIASELSSGISDVAGTAALVNQAPDIVSWVGTDGFLPNAAGLADALWLHGGPRHRSVA